MIEEIKYNNETYAYVMKADTHPESTKFYTPKECELQMGIVTHDRGYIEPAHIHKKHKKIIMDCIETLHIVYGKTKMNFFTKDGKKVGSIVLNKGDTILLKSDMGHQLESIEKFKGIKTKQGPYVSMDEDKEFLRV